jgi:NHLM bacteriocin system ABC transporter ATP-binding protein
MLDNLAPSAVLTLSGHDPLRLDGAPQIVLVTKGALSLFAVRLDAAGRPTGMRRHIICLEPGDAVPGWSKRNDVTALYAVAEGEAEAVVFDRDQTDPALSARMDRALAALGATGAPADVPAGAWSISPGETLALPPDQTVVGRPLAWVTVKTDEDAEESPVRLLTTRSYLTVRKPSRARARSTADVVAEQGWEPVDAVCDEALAWCAAEAALLDLEAADRLELRRRRDALNLRDALTGAGGGRGQTQADAAPAEAFADPVGRVLQSLAADIGLSLRAPVGDAPADATADDEILRYARASGFRRRKVSLPDRWRRRDLMTSFIAFNASDGAPRAVLRRGNGRYEILDAHGAARPITAAVAAGLSREAVQLIPPLPAGELTGRSIASAAFIGSWRDIRAIIAFSALMALSALLTPKLTGVLVNEAAPFAERGMILHMALGLCAMAFGEAAFSICRALLLTRVEGRADARLQAGLWDRLLRLPTGFFRRFSTGDLLLRALGPAHLRQVISDTAIGAILSAVFSVVNFVLMLSYDRRLALAALATAAVAGVILAGLAALQLRYERRAMEKSATVSGFLVETLSAPVKIRASGAEERFYARWLRFYTAQQHEEYRAGTAAAAFATVNAVIPLIAAVIFFIVYHNLSLDASAERISVGDFVAFNAAFGQFLAAALAAVTALTASMEALPIIARMKPILEATPENAEQKPEIDRLSGRVEVKGVRFRYGDGPLVLDEVNIVAEPGEFIALVGTSGSGKSTLLRLLLGFETPESGAVLYDGRALADVDVASVRRRMGVVLQSGTVLPGSILENIVGASSATIADAWRAADAAGLGDDLRALPMGLHTVVTEGGGALSGGQRQRLAIARALVHNPRLLLLDEATSALDNVAQAHVAESLSRLNATRIVVAHRLSTVIGADRIYVLEHGRIVQQGTYAALAAQEGPFKEMIARQA